MTARSFLWRRLIQRPVEDFKQAANLEGILSGAELLRDLAGAARPDAAEPRISEEGAALADAPQLDLTDPIAAALLRRSARNCHFFVAAGIGGVAIVIGLSLVGTGTISRVACIDLALVELLFTLGFLQQAAGNWRIRRGMPGSLVDFVLSGWSAWPRSQQEGTRLSTARRSNVETQA